MSVVRGITPLRATPQGLEVDLELLTGLPGFRRMVDEDVLLEVGAPGGDGEPVPGEVAAPAVFQLPSARCPWTTPPSPTSTVSSRPLSRRWWRWPPAGRCGSWGRG